MPISPEALLKFAEQIHDKNEDCEIHRRSAISRYYYAMYHKAKSILKEEPRIYSKSDHENLIRYLQSDARNDEDHDFRELVLLADLLRLERARRNAADYELKESITKVDANTTKDSAIFLFEKADQLSLQTKAS